MDLLFFFSLSPQKRNVLSSFYFWPSALGNVNEPTVAQHQITFLSFSLQSLFFSLFQAPFTPFITEMMYQNLRNLLDLASLEEKDTGSIHYLMLPQLRWVGGGIPSLHKNENFGELQWIT